MATSGSYKGRKYTGHTYETATKKSEKDIIGNMDDGGESNKIYAKQLDHHTAVDMDGDYYKSILHYYNQYDYKDIDLINKTYRFGLFNPYGTITRAKEFVFFTKPDLNIISRNDETGYLTGYLNSSLQSYPFWDELYRYKRRIVNLLQYSADPTDKFNHLLQNQLISNLEIPGLSATNIDTPTNMYGVGYSYRGSSEASDDNHDFSLEFKDTKWLDVYNYFRAYEEYETLKHHGTVRPWKKYITDKIIHDQIAIYKFIVDEDMETILYYGKMYGVMPTSLPRDVFSSATFDNGISYSINFRAAFYEDMKPEILADFNALSKEYYDSLPYQVDIYNDTLGRVDNRPAKAAYIETVKSNMSPNGYVYKLKWRGSDKV